MMLRSEKKTAKDVYLYDSIGSDKEGNEILVSDTSSVASDTNMADSEEMISHEQKRKVEDDQTPDVSSIFTEWKMREGIAW